MSLFDAPVHGAYVAVTSLAHGLQPLLGVSSTACAIVLFTLGVRILLLPLSYGQVRGDRARSRLMPKMQELRERHKNNPDKLNREMLKLQQENGTMFAGCLPMLAQLPFFFVMYQLFSSPTVAGEPNGLLTHELLGAPLGLGWLDALGSYPMVCLGLVAPLALVSWWSSQLTARSGATSGWIRLLPFGTVLFATFVPIATTVYLLITTTWTVAQRAVVSPVPADLQSVRQ